MKRIRNQVAMRLKFVLPFLFLSHFLFPKSWNFSVYVLTLQMYSSSLPNWTFGPVYLDWISMPCKDHSIDLMVSVKCYLPRHAVDTMGCLLTALPLYWCPCLLQVAQVNPVWCKKSRWSHSNCWRLLQTMRCWQEVCWRTSGKSSIIGLKEEIMPFLPLGNH